MAAVPVPAVATSAGAAAIFFFLQNEAKVTHFQFWMLSSLEWRMNDMAKRLAKIDENIQIMTELQEKSEGDKPEPGG